MDTSGTYLQQLCRVATSDSEINRKIRESLNDGTDATEDFCFMNQCGEIEYGTALNCLLTSYHATEEFVGEFLNQTSYNREWFVQKQEKMHVGNTSTKLQFPSFEEISSSPPSLYHQDSKGITALHVAVYQNSLHVDKIAKLLLDWNRSSIRYPTLSDDAKKCSLASIPMKCGSYPLHILTGQNLTIKEELLQTLLYADSSIVFKDDVNGDNPISLLWKNTLRFRWAISVVEGATFIDYIKNDDCSWMAVITPYQFIKFSLLMARAALRKDNDNDSTSDTGVNTIHDLCRIPRCPPMLLQLLQSPEYNAIFGVSGTAYTFDEDGMLPIHHAVQSPPVTYKFVPFFLKSQHQKSLVEILLERNPNCARVADDQGRLPLHYALDSGCMVEKDILALVRLYPDSLRKEDPKTGLLPFMLVAANQGMTAAASMPQVLPRLVEGFNEQNLLSPRYPERHIIMATKNDKNNVLVERYEAEWKSDHVRMSCRLLMLYPDVMIPFQTSFGTHTTV